MIKIGDFAKIFDVSIKTIRFYEEKGLLNPKYVDIYTGYRYFDDENIKEMSKIVALKKLGLELQDIKNFDNASLQHKIEELEKELFSLQQNINTLKTLSVNEKGEVKNMKTFINDESAIGKWELVGLANNKEDFKNNEMLDDTDYLLKNLYLMKNGESYWVISWTKNILYIKGRENPYEIENDLMFVTIKGLVDDSESKLAVYKKIDNKEYNVEEIKIQDNIDVPYEKDETVIGFWQTIDFVKNKNSFNPNKSQEVINELPLKKVTFTPDGEAHINYENNTETTKYTKDYIINFGLPNTLSKYELKEIDGKLYMIIEWKSGDYVFGGIINGYYILEKTN